MKVGISTKWNKQIRDLLWSLRLLLPTHPPLVAQSNAKIAPSTNGGEAKVDIPTRNVKLSTWTETTVSTMAPPPPPPLPQTDLAPETDVTLLERHNQMVETTTEFNDIFKVYRGVMIFLSILLNWMTHLMLWVDCIYRCQSDFFVKLGPPSSSWIPYNMGITPLWQGQFLLTKLRIMTVLGSILILLQIKFWAW